MANDNKGLTPMMRQFFEMKSKHPEALLLFRCGDFYETYCEDAVATGWSTGWRISLWARLHRADKSYSMIRKLLNYVHPGNYNNPKNRPSGGTYPNLFDAHPPFQIDGNFGGTAGICEMLMQCDGETMHLLPALPKEWPAGEIKGIKARGNYEINLVWNNGKVSKASITSKNAGNLTVKYNGKQKALNFKAGETKLIK